MGGWALPLGFIVICVPFMTLCISLCMALSCVIAWRRVSPLGGGGDDDRSLPMMMRLPRGSTDMYRPAEILSDSFISACRFLSIRQRRPQRHDDPERATDSSVQGPEVYNQGDLETEHEPACHLTELVPSQDAGSPISTCLRPQHPPRGAGVDLVAPPPHPPSKVPLAQDDPRSEPDKKKS